MQRIFRIVIKLYPEEHRQLFEREMLSVLAESAKQRGDGWSMPSVFRAGVDLTALRIGSVRERVARWREPQLYLCMGLNRPLPEQVCDEADLPALRSRLTDQIRLMERAIATHDFVSARFYADQERKTRHLLRSLENGASAAAQT